MKVPIIILSIVVIVIAFFFLRIWPKEVKNGIIKVSTYRKILLMQDKLYMDKNVTSAEKLADKDIAIKLIEVEILKHYPGFVRHGHKLILKQLEQVVGNDNVWYAQYDVYEGLDMAIDIKIDINTGEVIYYQDDWA